MVKKVGSVFDQTIRKCNNERSSGQILLLMIIYFARIDLRMVYLIIDYQFVAMFTKVCKTFKQMNNNKKKKIGETLDDEAGEVNDDYCSEDEYDDEMDGDGDGQMELGKGKSFFMNGHPGKEFAYLQKLKFRPSPSCLYLKIVYAV